MRSYIDEFASDVLNVLAHILPIPFAILQDQYGEVFEEKYPCKSCNAQVKRENALCAKCLIQKIRNTESVRLSPKVYKTKMFASKSEQKEV